MRAAGLLVGVLGAALALRSAVLLAGILVVTLAPAAIMLMGEAAWWLPRWMDRLLPHMDIEGQAFREGPAVPPAEPAPAPIPPGGS